MTTRLSKRDYGLDSGREGWDWRTFAACGVDPELWFSGRSHRDAQAIHICLRHCPVLDECRQETELNPPSVGVQAGVVWVWLTKERVNRPGTYQPARLPHGAFCDRWSDGG